MTPHEYIQSHPTLQGLEPFLVATTYNRAGFNLSPFGITIKESNLIDPTHSGSQAFCDLLLKLDSVTFGPEGMPMEKWVFYDICYMPGIVFGYGIPSQRASAEVLDLFEVTADDDLLIPLAMYGTIPMTYPRSWMGHNLCSIGKRVTSRNLRGLGTLSKSIALKLVKAERFFGATQWSSIALNVHVKFGPLQLYTAYTPAHSESHTLTYGFTCEDHALLAAAGHPDYAFERPMADLWINPSDEEGMIALHHRIEEGEQFVIPCPPRRTSEGHEVPITLVEPDLLSHFI
jgi:hypothetical protein